MFYGIADGQVQLPSEVPNSGQFCDYAQITRLSGTVVIRQRVNISDPVDPDRHAKISSDGGVFITPANDFSQQLENIRTSLEGRIDKLTKILARIANVNPDHI